MTTTPPEGQPASSQPQPVEPPIPPSMTPADEGPGEPSPGHTAEAADDDQSAPREWWEEPGLPWKHKPTRTDIACLTWMGVATVYALVLLPLRPVMLTLAPHVLGSLGYTTGLVLTGALTSLGDPWWPLVLILGALATMKFDWIYWWAGKLWGHGLIEVWSGRSQRAKRRNERAIRFAQKYEIPAILVTYLPLPIPAAVIYAALGAAGTRLPKFLIVNFIGSALRAALYLYLGYRIGEPAVKVVETYGQYLWYLSIALIVGVIAVTWWRSRNGGGRPSVPGPAV